MTLSVTWPQALAWRLERQLVDPIGNLPALEIVRRLGGVQAQVASCAELAIQLRQRTPARNEVAGALSDGSLIKTWGMRGTLHLFAADEAGSYLALLAAGRSWETPAWQRFFGLSPAKIEGLREVVRDVLDGRVLTREEVNAQIVKTRGYEHLAAELKSGWGTLFKPLAWQGDICFGPGRGTRVTFARPEQISSSWQPLPSADEAARPVFLRYFESYGPATPTHVRRWLARGRVSVKQQRAWFATVADEVTKVDVDGEEMYVRSEDIDALAASKGTYSVRLLGGFDEWVLGPGTDDPHVISPNRRAAVSRAAGWIAPIVLVGGVVRGTWRQDADRVAIDWFSESGKPPSAKLGSEVERLGALFGRRLTAELAVVRP
jgi:hypothetical protein